MSSDDTPIFMKVYPHGGDGYSSLEPKIEKYDPDVFQKLKVAESWTGRKKRYEWFGDLDYEYTKIVPLYLDYVESELQKLYNQKEDLDKAKKGTDRLIEKYKGYLDD